MKRNHAYGLALAAMATVAQTAGVQAQGIRSPVPVSVRARLDIQVMASESSGQWAVTSRSPSDSSRFMADLTMGKAATGVLYLKGVSSWSDADDALGRVQFRLNQGDYLYGFGWADSARADLRAFGDERRFFTPDLGTPLADDDVVDTFEHRVGGRADAHMESGRATYWVAALDDGDDRRTNQYASVRFAPRLAYAGISYLHDNPGAGENHAIAKAEVAGYVRNATAILSFAESATGSGMAFPSGDWNSGPGYAAASPDNAATYAEVRTHELRAGSDHAFVASFQYSLVGADYTDDLTQNTPGSVTQRAWIDWRHLRYALDARLSARRAVLWHSQQAEFRELDLTTRARMRDNSEWLFRGGVEDNDTDQFDDSQGFVHAGYTRELREFRGGLHVLVDEIGNDSRVQAGADIRMNWSASSAISGRWIVADQSGAGAFWVRLEFRPTRRTWMTLAYGREDRGDDVYFLEDRDVLPEPDTGNAITLTVRGDL